MDYRRWFDDSGMLYAYDLDDSPGKDHDTVVQIEKAWGGEVVGEKGRKSKKPILKFVGLEKTLALNKTNGKTISRLYGKDGAKWAGCWVTLYVTTVDYDGETRDCIRIRPSRPEVQKPAQNGGNARRFSKEEVEAARHDAAETLITQLDGCDDAEMFAALEDDRKRQWSVMSKDDKVRVKAAAEAAHSRLLAAAHSTAEAANRIGPDEVAEAEVQS